MSLRRSLPAAACLVLAALVPVLATPSVAGARAKVAVSPAAPREGSAITVRWRADGSLTRGQAYRVIVQAPSGAQGATCASRAERLAGRGSRNGRRFTVTIRPRTADGGRTWCSGNANVVVEAVVLKSPLGRPSALRQVGISRMFLIRLADGSVAPIAGSPMKTTLLEGSTLTVRVAGRPDRVSPLTGILRHEIPGRILFDSDISYDKTSGSLVATSLASDPLCTPDGLSGPRTLTADSSTRGLLMKSGRVELTLVLQGDPSTLTGCTPAAAPAATTTIALSGHSGPDGLAALKLSGSVGGVQLAGGGEATIDVSLVVSMDLSGKP